MMLGLYITFSLPISLISTSATVFPPANILTNAPGLLSFLISSAVILIPFCLIQTSPSLFHSTFSFFNNSSILLIFFATLFSHFLYIFKLCKIIFFNRRKIFNLIFFIFKKSFFHCFFLTNLPCIL